METYNGQVRTPNDAIILFEACRLGLLPRVQRRLSEKERQSIRSGSVFVWDEREAGMRRWTDGKSWSASRVSGSFLTYREMEGKRGSSSFVTPVTNRGTKTPDSGRNSAEDQNGDAEEGPDGYRYKPDGLMKQSFSLTTSTGQHLHLISYYSRSHPAAGNMRQPSNDPSLAQIQIPKGMYPESTLSDNTPPTTRSPMAGVAGVPGYAMAGPNAQFNRPAAIPPGYYVPHPGFMYPISPVHTPPGYPLYHPAGMPALGYPPYTGQPPLPMNQAPPSHLYDQRPQRAGMQPLSSPTGNGPQHPNMYSPYGQSQPPPPVEKDPQPAPQPPQQEAYAPIQIDPRLTGASAPPPPSNATPTPASAPAPAPQIELSRPPGHPYEAATTSASQIPTIGALVHGAAPKSPRPVSGGGVDAKAEREGSTSPGGTRHGAPPQDIPSEKLAFREDKMALSKLDRVFARV